jgi:outer membrane protein assembly factor BamA
MIISFFSCNSTKKLHIGEYLLNSNKIIYRFGSTQKAKGLTSDITGLGKEGIEQFEIPQRIAPSEVLPYVKQKPNTRILFILPFYLYLYNIPDSANTAKAKLRRDSAYAIKAIKKGWTQEKLKRKKARATGREWIMSQGEAPVILDSSLTQKSTEQIKTFLFNKGYFNGGVKDSIHIRGKKAEVIYIIKPGKPYKIHQIEYLFEDPGLAAEILSDTANSKIRRNEVYDQDILDAERDRITTELNNAGYYYFTKQYVSYELDTNSATHLINLTVNIKKFVERDPKNKDSTIEVPHLFYRIRHVTVQMNYDPAVAIYHADDTLKYDGLTIVYPKDQILLKPNIFKPRIFITPGDVYRITNREDTYTGLSQLDEFTYVNVKYMPIKDSNYVDCYIQLLPRVKHSFGAEFEVTNTGGDGGVQGDVSYGNYNQFNGAEKLQFKLNGGLIAEQILASGGSNGNISKYIPLNTVDLGPELDFAVPRPWFPFNLFHFARKVNPQSSLKLTFDYQQRPDYLRHLLGLSYAFDYNPVKNQHFTFALFEVNFVNALLAPQFAQELDQYNLFFQNSFKNQVITDGRISWSFTTQDPTSIKQKHFFYAKVNFEFSGLIFDAFEHWHLIHLPADSGNIYYIRQFTAPYSQYTKLDGELRQYILRGKKQKFVFRELLGYGLPYDNSSELPFTKSFWAGGSNDIRAWQIQTLGPGGSSQSSSAVAGQIGDVKAEANFEYRVSLIKYFGLAYFIDAGNIWLLPSKANESIPLSTIQFSGQNPAWSEVAIGTGIGFRFDFNYFVFRIDLGQPVRDPSRLPGDRMIALDKYTTRKTVLNIGIGYPF